MLTIYLCFLTGGVVFIFISFIMGSLSNDVDTDVSTDIDLNTDVSTDIDLNTDVSMDTGGTADSATGMDTGTEMNTDMDSIISIGLVPVSLLSISTLATIFGAAGALMTIGKAGKIVTFVTAAILGYLASVIIQTIIKSLKKVQSSNSGINENELLLYDGKIIDTILPGQLGTVSFVTLKNELVSYPAKCADSNLKLKTGRIVKVVEFKNGIFIVEPKNKYE